MASQSVRTGCPVLVISYESFRNYATVLNESEVGLLLCDEGHRLKNCENQTYNALMGLKTKRRVLLSGTPIQNDLTEYYSLIHFVNPGMLGTRNVSSTISIENVDQNKIEIIHFISIRLQEFKKNYENIILRGQDAGCFGKDREKALEKVTALTNIVNQCLIRRTNQILTKYLPVKFEMVICVKLSPIQTNIYKSFLASDSVRKTVLGNQILTYFSYVFLSNYLKLPLGIIKTGKEDGKSSLSVLANITNLKKLCNHPDLVGEKIQDGTDGFENTAKYMPDGYNKKYVTVRDNKSGFGAIKNVC